MSRKSILANQVLLTLREEIAEGVTPQGGFLPSEKSLCERFEVSRITVRLALTKLAEAGLIQSRPGKGWQVCSPSDVPSAGLTPAPVPPAVSEQRDVYLLTRHSVLSTYLFQGVSDVLSPAGYSTRLFMLPNGYESDVKIVLDGLRDKAPAGVCLFTDLHLNNEYLSGLKTLQAPLLVCGSCEHLFCDTLTFDLREGSRKMVHYLCASGYERIVYHCYSKLRHDLPTFRMRAKGYLEGMAEAGLKPEVVETDFRLDYDTAMQERLLKTLAAGGGRRTGIFCDLNDLAKSTCQILLRAGKAVPQAYGLCGVGSGSDNQLHANNGELALTCVEEEWQQAGLSCGWQLLSRLRGDTSRPRLILLNTDILAGNTL